LKVLKKLQKLMVAGGDRISAIHIKPSIYEKIITR
jgi:hypothetical protein